MANTKTISRRVDKYHHQGQRQRLDSSCQQDRAYCTFFFWQWDAYIHPLKPYSPLYTYKLKPSIFHKHLTPIDIATQPLFYVHIMPRWTKRQERDYDAYSNRDIENGEHSKAYSDQCEKARNATKKDWNVR